MLRRVAGNCFWLGRYIERAEDTARLVAAAAQVPGEDPPIWASCLTLVAALERYRSVAGEITSAAAASFLLVERLNLSSVVQSLRAAGANARSARDLLGDPFFESVNQAWLEADAYDGEDLVEPQALETGVVAGTSIEHLTDWALQHCRTIRGGLEEVLDPQARHAVSAGGAFERIDFLLRVLQALAEGGDAPGAATLRLVLAQAAGCVDGGITVGARGASAWRAITAGAGPRALPGTVARLEAASLALFGEGSVVRVVGDLRAHLGLLGSQPASPGAREARQAMQRLLLELAAMLEREHFSDDIPPSASQRQASS